MLTRCAGLACATLLLGAAAARAQDGGIEVVSGRTIFEHGIRVTAGYQYERKSSLWHHGERIPDPQDRLYEEHRTVLGAAYGFRPDLTGYVLLPYVERQQASTSAAGRVRIGDAGMGDADVLVKWRGFKRDWERGTLNVSLIAGLELPTGDVNERAGGARLKPGFQLGSGSVDPLLAGAAMGALGRLRYDAAVSWRWNVDGAHAYDKGDVVQARADVGYQFLLKKFPGPSASAKLGVTWRREGPSHQATDRIANSGSTVWIGRLALSAHPAPAHDLTVTIEFPLHQRMRGDQLGLEWRGGCVFGYRF